MKKSWIIAIGLFAGVAALVLLNRFGHDESLPDRLAQREQRGSSGQYGAGQSRGAGENRGEGESRGSSSGGRPRAGSSGDIADHVRAGLDRSAGGPSRGRDGRGELAAHDEGGSERLADRGRTADAPLSRPDLPSGPGRDMHAQGDGSDPAEDEPIPDVAYDGGDKVFDTSKKVEISDAAIATANGSMAFWVEPQWEENNEDGATFLQLGDNGLRVVKKGNTLSFEYTDSTGAVQGGSADIADWHSGDWRHVAAVWADGSLSLYVDGAQIFLNHAANPPSSPVGSVLYIGSDPSNGSAIAPAQVFYPKLWNHQLSVDEVRQLFESGGQPIQ